MVTVFVPLWPYIYGQFQPQLYLEFEWNLQNILDFNFVQT